MSYVMVGNKMIDSEEILQNIKEQLPFKGIKDITKGAKRDDTLIFQVYHDVGSLKEFLDVEEMRDLSEEELIDELMELADEKTSEIEDYIPEGLMTFSYSYYYDEAENRIKSVFIAVDQEVGELRLRDIAERVLRSLD
ncbi:hypothetical protein [Alkaliphilus serpentinus]|uniref:Uncharacterized protein n=1 Tax=Alkaliphilus serpentinus TaxID=1482731 RepID=A0A833MAW8_9FIRM|nr:hypothetical protein [Alkaliphilus serpentinus]KAB3531793.1 hypothetical protein F8153_03490 [Alkaliphilus serpentinus]